MSLLTNTALKRIESKYSDGIAAAVVVKIFQDKGERFSEATLRKYVQLGLLPTSRRVGIRGKHRGSSGLYPVMIVRLANQVKAALEAGHTLVDIRSSTIGLTGEVQLLRRASQQLLQRLGQAVLQRPSPTGKAVLKRALAGHSKGLEQQIRAIEAFVESLGQRATR